MERQEKQAIYILILVIGIVSGAHVILSALGSEPFAAPYDDRVSEGKLVRLEGAVDSLSITEEGGHTLLHVRGIQVFIPASVANQMNIRIGDQIRIYGVVQVYRGQREVTVSRPSDITIL